MALSAVALAALAFSLLPPARAQQEAQSAPAVQSITPDYGYGQIIVRVDDRHIRNLSAPWVQIIGNDGPIAEVRLSDSGTDPEDRVAGDRLYVSRVQTNQLGEVQIRVTEGTSSRGRLLKMVRGRLVSGGTLRVSVVIGNDDPGTQRKPAEMAATSGDKASKGGPDGQGDPEEDLAEADKVKRRSNPATEEAARDEPHRTIVFDPLEVGRENETIAVVSWPRWTLPVLAVLFGLPLMSGLALRQVVRRALSFVEELNLVLRRLRKVSPPLPRPRGAAFRDNSL